MRKSSFHAAVVLIPWVGGEGMESEGLREREVGAEGGCMGREGFMERGAVERGSGREGKGEKVVGVFTSVFFSF